MNIKPTIIIDFSRTEDAVAFAVELITNWGDIISRPNHCNKVHIYENPYTEEVAVDISVVCTQLGISNYEITTP